MRKISRIKNVNNLFYRLILQAIQDYINEPAFIVNKTKSTKKEIANYDWITAEALIFGTFQKDTILINPFTGLSEQHFAGDKYYIEDNEGRTLSTADILDLAEISEDNWKKMKRKVIRLAAEKEGIEDIEKRLEHLQMSLL